MPPGVFWGGEVATSKLTGFLTREVACVYTTLAAQEFILEQDLRPDPHGNVEVLDAFWETWPHAMRGAASASTVAMRSLSDRRNQVPACHAELEQGLQQQVYRDRGIALLHLRKA